MIRRIERGIAFAQPLTFGIAAVLSRFATDFTTPNGLVRPILVVAAFAALCLGLAWLVTRGSAWAPMVASALVLFALWEPVPASVLAILVVWWLLIRGIRLVVGLKPPPGRFPFLLARTTGIFSVALLIVYAINGFTSYSSGMIPVAGVDVRLSGTAARPNIYFFLLDGYPRADTLDRVFDIDNEPFLRDLETLGFDISDAARTNYNKTWLTLASMLNGTYVDKLLAGRAVPADRVMQLRWLHSMIEEASLLESLRNIGYVIRTTPPPFDSAALTSADDYIDHGHLTEFEYKLLTHSPLAQIFRDAVARWVESAQRDVVLDSLETTVELAEYPTDEPQFVLTHVHSPHPPFVLGPNGAGDRLPSCFPRSCSMWTAPIEGMNIVMSLYRDGLAHQIQALDHVLVSTVERIIVADPRAVVILMSDHGSRYSLSYQSEHFRSFLAARTPGAPQLYDEDESPVNLLPKLFGELFGADLPTMPYAAWYGDWDSYLELRPFTPH